MDSSEDKGEKLFLAPDTDSGFWDKVVGLLKADDWEGVRGFVYENETNASLAYAQIEFVMKKFAPTEMQGMSAEGEAALRLALARSLGSDPLAAADAVAPVMADASQALRLVVKCHHGARCVSHLEEMRVDEIREVEVAVDDDSCDACKALGGKKYPLDDTPVLPNEACTHPVGCRCDFDKVEPELPSAPGACGD